MLIRRPSDISPSEITPRDQYLRRREFMAGAAALGVGSVIATMRGKAAKAAPLEASKSSLSTTDEPLTPLKDITSYNNYYEFGTDKEDPARNAHTLTIKPWRIKIDGLVAKPADYDLDDLIKPSQLEERIYRMRCVEGWSMVIPWVGVPLAPLLQRLEPQASAKYVAFETLVRPAEMPGQRGLFQPLPWPYVEGLRLDEAMHPLAILAVGLYGETLPNQNGAPVRLQGHQVDCAHQPHRQAAANDVEHRKPPRVRLLFQRQPGR
jgi:methionine sulfoxide reductase catalytic subunit